MDSKLLKQGVAEFFGTAVLVLGGAGTAVFSSQYVGVLGVAFAFGLSLLVMAYTIGNISGCHINPAVTTAMWVAGKINSTKAVIYWIAQILGGALGGLIIYVIASGRDGFEIGETAGAFATNGYGNLSPAGYSMLAVIVAELVLTAVFTFVVLQTTNDDFPAGFGGIAAGLSLTWVHLISIPISNTSVNPARSLGVAIFAPEALKQVWIFILVPMAGGIIGAAHYVYFNSEKFNFGEKKEKVAVETITEEIKTEETVKVEKETTKNDADRRKEEEDRRKEDRREDEESDEE